MHHALMIASRVVAGIVAALAFYFAFFLYEDEERFWQNRLELAWVSISDRARETNSATTALFNRVARIATSALDWLFGPRLISVKSLAASIIFSLGFAIITTVWLLSRHILHDPRLPSLLIIAQLISGSIIFVMCATIFDNALHIEGTPWHPWFTISAALVSITSFVYAPVIFGWKTLYRDAPHSFIGASGSIMLSIGSDMLGVVIIRWLSRTIENTLTISRILLYILSCFALVIAVEALPFFIVKEISTIPALSHTTMRGVLGSTLNLIIFMNLWTAVYCLFPIPIFFVLVVHKALWPVLSRIIYPLTRYELLTNKKVLIPVAILALTFAFNLEHVGAKEILKLLSP